MNLLQEVLDNEVYPALGCTEPVSCAFAAAVAASHLGNPVDRLDIKVDAATYKNGAAVTVPHSGNRKGNMFAALMGAVLALPDGNLQLLRSANDETVSRASELLDSGNWSYDWIRATTGFRVEAIASSGPEECRCVLSEGHTNIALIEKDGVALHADSGDSPESTALAYRDRLREMSLREILTLAANPDQQVTGRLVEGIEMNLALSDAGADVEGTAYQLSHMRKKGLIADDMFCRTKLKVAAAVDARMAGRPLPAMTSGGSGNQGIVAILTPYCIARETGIDDVRMHESIAVAHLTNAYVKCYVGELAAVCGCALAAGVAVAVALVSQRAWLDMERITSAVNNVIGDLGGLICDGAKAGCAMKTITSVDAAVRSAFMALDGFGLSSDDGVLGATAEQSIQNLGRMTLEGMSMVDPTVLKIMQEKLS